MAVPGDSNAVGVGHSKPYRLIDRGLGIGNELIHIGVIGFLWVSDDGERSVVDDRVASEKQ